MLKFRILEKHINLGERVVGIRGLKRINHYIKRATTLTAIGILSFTIAIPNVVSATPGDIVYKPAIGKLGQNNPFKTLFNPEKLAVDSVGRIYVLDYSNTRVVRMNSDGSEPKILADVSTNVPYLDSDYYINNVDNPTIEGFVIGANDTLYLFTAKGINTFNASGDYINFKPFLVEGDSSAITSRVEIYMDTQSEKIFAAKEECTVTTYECEPNSRHIRVDIYDTNGNHVDANEYPISDSKQPLQFIAIVKGSLNTITIFTNHTILALNEDLTVFSAFDINEPVQNMKRIAKNEITYIYSGDTDIRTVETFNLNGTSLRTSQFTTEEIAAMPYKREYDSFGNTYIFEGQWSAESLTKYSSSNTAVFTKNRTPELGTFERPNSVAVDSKNNAYVYDACSIQKFSNDGDVLFRFGKSGTGPGELSCGVKDIAVNNQDQLVVFDKGAAKIIVFSENGAFIRDHSIATDIEATSGYVNGDIQVSANGEIFLLGYDGVHIYSSDFSNHMHRSFTGLPEPIVTPSDFALNKAGELYVLDTYSSKVTKFDASGAYKMSFGGRGSADEQFDTPYAIAIDKPGNLYIADLKTSDTTFSQIKKFGAEGEYLMKFGSDNATESMYINSAYALATNPNYDIYVLDRGTAEVKRYEIEKNNSTIISADGRRVIDNPTISKKPTFAGSTEPYSKVTVTVYSDPVTCEALADANGNWSCTLPTGLPAGQHSMEVSIALANDTTLEVGPYPVRVSGGLGATNANLSEGLLAPNTGVQKRNSMPIAPTFMILSAIVSLIGLCLVVILNKYKFKG
jgi:hypothetical protein